MLSLLKKIRPIDWIVLVAWAMYPLGTYVIAVFSKLPLIGDFSRAIVPLFYCVMVLIAFRSIQHKIRLQDIGFFIFVAVLFILGLNSSVSIYLLPYAAPLFLSALPMYFIGVIIDVDRIQKPLFFISFICIFAQLFYVFFYQQSTSSTVEELTEERMYASYQILPHVIICIWYMLNKFNLFGFFASLTGVTMMLVYGARGPMVCCALFIFLFVVFVLGLFKNKYFLVVSITVVFIGFIFFDEIVYFFYDTLASLGLNTRIIEFLIQDELINNSSIDARDEYAVATIRDISDNMLFGRGMAGDRIAAKGSYCHNFALEIWASYGVFLGSFMLIFLAVLFITSFLKGDNIEKAFLLLLLCSGFFKLFMSSTYIDDRYFYFAIGYSVNIIRHHRSTKSIIQHNEMGIISA